MKAKEIVFATNNRHKLGEARSILEPRGWQVLSLDDIGCHDEIEETGTTLSQNAAIKALHVLRHYGYSCFADDTGLFVDALGGAPGVYSARYAGTQGDSQANMRRLLKEMEGVECRAAAFRTVIAFAHGTDTVDEFEGAVHGSILCEPRGTDGFGYDPVFLPDGYQLTFAQMDANAKNAISHRRRALDKFVDSGILDTITHN